jgi:hypothetical protein
MQLELSTRLRQEIVRDLLDLQLDYWLSSGQEETVLAQLWRREVSEARRLQVCEMIALGTCDVQIANIEHCHDLILQRCEQEGREQFNVRRALADFLDTHDSRNSSANPPTTLVAESQAITLGRKRVNFVKLSEDGIRIALLIEGESEFGLAVFGVSGHIIKKEMSLMGDALGWVTQVKWSRFQQPGRDCIAICAYDKVLVVSALDELRIVLTIDRKRLAIGKFLCFEWHPISEILYVGGLFDKLLGLDAGGELATELNPYCKTRELVFSPAGKLFTIGATKQGQLVRYCVDEERVEARFTASSALFMDLKYCEGVLVATTREFIYVIEAESMEVLNLIGSPPNERLLKIEAFLCNSWVVVFNQTLRGVRQEGGVLMRSKWHNCEAVDVAHRRMVTFHSSLRLWDSHPPPARPRKTPQQSDEYTTPHRPVQPLHPHPHPHSPSSSSLSSSSSDEM